MKQESRIKKPWEIGVWHADEPKQGRRSDLEGPARAIAAGTTLSSIARAFPIQYIKYYRGFAAYRSALLNPEPLDDEEEADPPWICLFYGPPGCGKSRAARAGTPPSKRWVHKAGQSKWMDGYVNQPLAILDDFRGAASHWELDNWLNIFDRYQDAQVEVKGGFTFFRPKTVYFTTNTHPRDWWDWTTRIEQFGALQRRFHCVYHWRSGETSPCIFTPVGPGGDSSDWDRWWAGPRLAVPGVLGPMDLWAEGRAADTAYDFV